jgi:prepilin-type N-terminal cleavage/methylation domain-containing protein/prepilin-type processing-associated H-X9-DG protein
MNSKRLSGFTLIEILVVIVIIALLAGILFPVFSQSREKARASSCLSNQKQIGLALKMYLQDNDGYFPPHESWRDGHVFAASRTMRCPDVSVRCPAPYPCGYGLNIQAMSMTAGQAPPSESTVRFPSQFITVAEVLYERSQGIAPLSYLESLQKMSDNSYERHHGGAHYLFFDGHVKWLQPGIISTNRATDEEDGKKPSFVR